MAGDPDVNVEALQTAALAGIRHGFLGRRGGVSAGDCAGLNVGWGSGDAREAIAENRRRAVGAVAPGAALVTLHQVHSGDALAVTASWPDDARPHADGMATDRPGLVLGILTADCAPILFADGQAGVIGAAHAGWKGARGGVVEATLRAMESLGADRARIAGAVGPCIARRSYEVDEAFLRRFAEVDPENERFFSDGARPDRRQFDLEGYVLSRLAAAGLTRIEALGEDTYSQPDRFFSYRRATHRGEPDYGRQISLIAL
jgi:YfiH family protein